MGAEDDPLSAKTSAPSTPPDITWTKVPSDPRNAPEPGGMFSSDQYLPTARSYHQFMPQCVELYWEHIYPIMPLLYMPEIRAAIRRPLQPTEKNLIYALCALTCFHMSGKSIEAAGPDSWETAGRFFLDECISVRQSYDFLEDHSLYAVISSFWLSTSFFEINQSKKSWIYLAEALALALYMGLDDDSTYAGYDPTEKLCRQRVFWQLFVTERSFAILRNKPIMFKKTPSRPTHGHEYESPDIHSGFLQLISSYVPLDESFVTAWNDGSDPRVSSYTYIELQNRLAATPAFSLRSRSSRPSPSPSDMAGSEVYDQEQPDPTPIQKADLLITQQWLRLIVWQSSFKQQLLSWSSTHESMHFAFPLAIARRTASILESLPSKAVEVHGMGIFEKIFEIGTWCINVLGAYDSAATSGIHPSVERNIAGWLGMDFVGGGASDLGVLGVGRKGVAIDPLEFFVKTLSASPNSRTKFAEHLLRFAAERPGGMKMALSPTLQFQTMNMYNGESAASSVVGTVTEISFSDAAEDSEQSKPEVTSGLSPTDTSPSHYFGERITGSVGGPTPLTNRVSETLGTYYEPLVSPALSVPLSDWSGSDRQPYEVLRLGPEAGVATGLEDDSINMPGLSPGMLLVRTSHDGTTSIVDLQQGSGLVDTQENDDRTRMLWEGGLGVW